MDTQMYTKGVRELILKVKFNHSGKVVVSNHRNLVIKPPTTKHSNVGSISPRKKRQIDDETRRVMIKYQQRLEIQNRNDETRRMMIEDHRRLEIQDRKEFRTSVLAKNRYDETRRMMIEDQRRLETQNRKELRKSILAKKKKKQKSSLTRTARLSRKKKQVKIKLRKKVKLHASISGKSMQMRIDDYKKTEHYRITHSCIITKYGKGIIIEKRKDGSIKVKLDWNGILYLNPNSDRLSEEAILNILQQREAKTRILQRVMAAYDKWQKEFDKKTKVCLNGKKLTDDDAVAIGKLLKVNCTLKELWIYNSAITNIRSIGEALKTNNTLEDLILVNNNITDVKSIGEALETNNTLTTLALDYNNISDINDIGKGLKSNKKLKYLALGNNRITNVQSIGKALTTNIALNVLHLGDNNVTDVESIIKGLEKNISLKVLSVGDIKMTDVQSIIKTNDTLKQLHVYNDLFGNDRNIGSPYILPHANTLYNVHLDIPIGRNNPNIFGTHDTPSRYNIKSKLEDVTVYEKKGSKGYERLKWMGIFTHTTSAGENTKQQKKRVERLKKMILALDQKTIAEIKSFNTPKPPVINSMKASLYLLGNTKNELKDWKHIVALMNKTGKKSLQRRIKNLETNIIPPNLKKAKKCLKGMDINSIQEISEGAAVFYGWASSIITLYSV